MLNSQLKLDTDLSAFTNPNTHSALCAVPRVTLHMVCLRGVSKGCHLHSVCIFNGLYWSHPALLLRALTLTHQNPTSRRGKGCCFTPWKPLVAFCAEGQVHYLFPKPVLETLKLKGKNNKASHGGANL